MQSGKYMTKKTERSTIVMGETTENMGSLKKNRKHQKIFLSKKYVKWQQSISLKNNLETDECHLNEIYPFLSSSGWAKVKFSI